MSFTLRPILFPILLPALMMLGCARDASTASSSTASNQVAAAAAPALHMPEGHVPAYARQEAERYRADFLRKNAEAARDLSWRFFYNEKEDACLEVTVSGKEGYTWPTPTWIGMTWAEGSGQVGNGEIHFTMTRKKEDEAEWRMDQRRKEDLFREVEALVLSVAREYDYDFESAYGQRVKYRVQTRLAVCDGYADAAQRTLAGHPQVAGVEKWASRAGNHAWNVLLLKDGRRLFCDATWYDGQGLDEEGFVETEPRRDPVCLTFDEAEFNSLGGAVDVATGRAVAVHFAWKDARRER